MIRHVVFDIGWVLVHLDYERLLHLVRDPGGGPVDFNTLLASIGLEDHECGRIDGEQLVANIARAAGDSVSHEDAKTAWNGMFELQPRMVDLARRLSERYRVHLLSNVGELHWAHLTDTYGLDRIGHGALPSFVSGVMKPHERIYAEAERRFALEPAATVFIDDRAENIAAARARGWRGIVHTGHDATVAGLLGLGVDAG